MVPRIGDEVIVSCESATARVVEVDRYITLEWPWGTIDNSSNFRRNGQVALPHSEEYDPPHNFGRAPASTAGIYVVPPERTDVDMEDAGYMLYLGGAEPIHVEPVKD